MSRVVNKAEMYGQATFAGSPIYADIFHYFILFCSANVVITIFKSDKTLRGLCACSDVLLYVTLFLRPPRHLRVKKKCAKNEIVFWW